MCRIMDEAIAIAEAEKVAKAFAEERENNLKALSILGISEEAYENVMRDLSQRIKYL